uniref:CST complex subunit CTC1 n=1 Tax=Oryzias latipes TaxID=8090 RepID=A0A3B3HPY4_ORYLA
MVSECCLQLSPVLQVIPCFSCCCVSGVEQLSIRVVQEIQQRSSVTHCLPVSYRILSISELVSQQKLACVSNFSWTTNQHRAWAKEVELSLPGQRALPRVNMLLIGCLTDGRGGEWRLMDSSGSVRCEVLSPSPLWLNRPVLVPHWNYIPHDASGQDVDRQHLELNGSPVFLCPEAEHGLATAVDGAELKAVAVSEVRPRGGPGRLWWRACMRTGRSVCVTALRTCVLRGWRGNNILCVTEQSQLHTDYTPIHTHQHTHTPTHPHQHPNTPTQTHQHPDFSQSGVRVKQSRIISYQGTVTEVVSEGAGLYVLDRNLGLCVAYQPPARRRLRIIDLLQLHHVHFLYRPCPDGPPSMLCTCLRSSITVTSYSRVGGSEPAPRCPGDGVLSRLLLQKCRGVSEYLWACHLSSQLSSPDWLQPVSGRVHQSAPARRDIYSEMLDQPHTCPLTQVHLSCNSGCLVCVLQFSMVIERFLQSEFPSVHHLDQENFISHRDCRYKVYLQFSLDHLIILSPSVTMTTYLRHKGEESGDDVPDQHENHEKGEQGWKRKRREEEEDSSDSSDVMTADSVGGASQSWISMVIRVEHKGGVVWKNTEKREGLQLCFSLRAAVIGPVVSWRRDPKNTALTEEEAEPGKEQKVQLLFSGVCSRWFPVLQPGPLYRVVMSQVKHLSLRVYLDLSHAPYPTGLLPGSTVLLSDFQRKLSRYRVHTDVSMKSSSQVSLLLSCKPVHLCVSGQGVLALPPPIMHLGQWGLKGQKENVMGLVRGHVVCFLFLQLWWSCSTCSSDCMQVTVCDFTQVTAYR